MQVRTQAISAVHVMKNVEDIYALSGMQEGILFHIFAEPESGAYVEQAAWTMEGEFDLAAFEAAWREVISRHPVLRTCFLIENVDKPLQVVRRQVKFHVQTCDWRTVPATARAQHEQLHLEDERRRGFALTQAPLMKVTAVRMDDQAWRIIWTWHHLILDGWSVSLVLSDIFAFYLALRAGRKIHRAPSRIYRDYIAWLQQQDSSQAEVYWRSRLQGFEPELLSASLSGESRKTSSEYSTRRLRMSTGEILLLQEFARAHRITVNTIVQAAWALLLSRYSGSWDVVFGAVVSGRSLPLEGIESIPGLFLNTLPLRADAEPGQTPLSFLHRIHADHLEARRFEHFPLARIQKWGGIQHGRQLFESIVVFENLPAVDMAPRNGRDLVRDFVHSNARAGYPLTLQVFPEEELRLELTFDTSRFDTTAAERMLFHLQVALHSMTAGLDCLANVELLTPPERQQVVSEWNDTQTGETSRPLLHELIRRQAARTPDAIAVVCGSQHLTYAELDAHSDRLARSFAQLGAGPERLVAIFAARSIELVSSLLAILKTGAAYLPLDPSYPPARLAFMLQDCGAELAVTQRELLPLWPSAERVRAVCLEDILTAPAQGPFRTPMLSQDCAAYAIYTSGSTGNPKAAINTHAAIVNRLMWMQDAYGLTKADRVLQKTPISFDVSIWEFFWPLVAGAQLVLAPPDAHQSSATLKDLIVREGITTTHFVPSMLHAFLEEPGVELCSSLRRVFSSGEALTAELRARFRQRLRAKLYNLYGPTEASVDVTAWDCSRDPQTLTVPIGRPIHNVTLRILNRSLRLAPIGVPGELNIGGVALARSYLNRPDLTAERFIPDPYAQEQGARLYRTGDRVRYLPDGTIEFLGRLDQQVKLRGFRIELGEIESALRLHPDVADAVAVLREDGVRPQLVAYYIPRSVRPLAAEELHDFLAHRLPAYMAPNSFVSLTAWPLSPSGKLDRRLLPAPDQAFAQNLPFVGPRTAAEKTLAGIWSKVLNIGEPGIFANFFELGGDSILAMLVSAKARQAGLNLTPRDILGRPTIAALATMSEPVAQKPLDQIARTGTDFPLASLDRSELDALMAAHSEIEDIYRLSPIQHGLLFHHLHSPESDVYFEQCTFTIQGSLQTAMLKKAWQMTIDRHPILRTSFAWKALGEPVQIVHRVVEAQAEELDWRDLEADNQNRRRSALLEADLLRSFDLESAPLLRLTIVRQAPDLWFCILSYHHLLLDGWSLLLVMRELLSRYESLTAGAQQEFPPVRPYRDYIAWLDQQHLDAEAFWRRKLQDFEPLPPIFGAARPNLPEGASELSEEQTLTTSATEGVVQFARTRHVTLNTVVLGIWALLLGRWTARDDVILGATISCRPVEHSNFEDMIGLLINTVPVRTQLILDEVTSGWLSRLQAEQTQLTSYASTPLASIQSWSGTTPGRPLFESVLVFQNYRRETLQEETYAGLTFTDFGNLERSTWPLMLVVEPGSRLRLKLIYNGSRFERTTILKLLQQITFLLQAIPELSTKTVGELPVLIPAERHQVLVEWNDTQAPFPQEAGYHHLFEAQARRTPQALAVTFREQQLTYSELNGWANQIARAVQSLGAGPEKIVGVCLERSTDLVAARLAALKAGAAYLPLDPDLPHERLALLLGQAGAVAVITQEPLRDHLAASGTPVLCLDSARNQILRQSTDDLAVAISPQNLAYIIYTSGSTGEPKGVATEHAGFVNLVTWHNLAYRVTPADRKSQLSGLGFDASVWEMWPYLAIGASVYIPDNETRADWPKLLQWMLRQRITISFLPTPLAEAVIEEPWPADIALRALLTGGDRLHQWPRRPLPFDFVNKYGPTEVTAVTSWSPFRPGSPSCSDSPSIGRAIANLQVYVLDRELRPVPSGAPGELCIGGIGLARGYHGRGDLTAEKFVPNPFSAQSGLRLYRTGDMVRWARSGELEFIGRVDTQVKIRGFRIELGEIESALRGDTEVRGAVVLARPSSSGAVQLIAYVVPQDRKRFPVEEVRQRLRKKLPDYMVPALFVVLDSFALTPNGKVNRNALPDPEPDTSSNYAEPRNELEHALADIWRRVLGRHRVGIHDNFFEAGGDSMLSVRICAAADAKGIELTPAKLFEFPTIAELAVQVNFSATAPSPSMPVEEVGSAGIESAGLSRRELDMLAVQFGKRN
jgi:amino acid adenylation domain-containing protein